MRKVMKYKFEFQSSEEIFQLNVKNKILKRDNE